MRRSSPQGCMIVAGGRQTTGPSHQISSHPGRVRDELNGFWHPFRVCRKNKLCASLCDLCASVVNDFLGIFNHRDTEDAQSYTEKSFFRQALSGCRRGSSRIPKILRGVNEVLNALI